MHDIACCDIVRANMTVNVEVVKNSNENTTSLIKRFSKRVRESGILPKLRNSLYYQRKESDYKKKQRALRALEKRKEIERLKKLGKIPG